MADSAVASGLSGATISAGPHAVRPIRAAAPRAAVASATRSFIGGPSSGLLGPLCAGRAQPASVRRSGLVNRQAYGEPRATFRCVTGLDGATEPADQPVREGEAQAGADLAFPAVPLGHGAPLEHHCQVGVGESGATVAYLHSGQSIAVGRAYGEDHRRTVGYHPQRVVHQDVDDLPEPARVIDVLMDN